MNRQKGLYLSERRCSNGTHQSTQRHRHHQRDFGRLSEIQQELPVDLLLAEYGSAHIGHAGSPSKPDVTPAPLRSEANGIINMMGGASDRLRLS